MDNLKKKKGERRGFYSLIIFCLVLLFNPNINVIDLLPDFIAYFILAKLFEDPSDTAPYFAEARAAFIKLGWLNLGKIFGMLVISAERSHNAFNNDIIPLVSFVFAVGEIILLLPAVRNTFEALFRLGERSEASALIKPFGRITPDSLRSLTYLFAICKCVVYFLPDVFLLTKTNDGISSTQIITISKYYPIFLISAQLVGLVIGIVWLTYSVRYVRAIREEGKLVAALEGIARLNEPARENKRTLRKMKFAVTMLFISSLFSFEFTFDTYSDVNMLPHFIYAATLTYALTKLFGRSAYKRTMAVLGGIYTASTVAFYFVQTKFLVNYGYEAMLTSKAAREAYGSVRILGTVEFAALFALLLCGVLAMRKFVLEHTGISPKSERYGSLEKEFHGAMLARGYTFFGTALLAGLAKFGGVFINGAVKVIFTHPDDVTQPTIIAPAVAWFGVVIVATAVIYAGFALYLSTVLKEELDMKYSEYNL